MKTKKEQHHTRNNAVLTNQFFIIIIIDVTIYTIIFFAVKRGIIVRKAVTFIVRAVDEKAPVIGCLNSIYRQLNKAFEVVAITNIEGFEEELKNKYEGIKVVKIKGKKDFVKISNKLIKEMETQYFVYANKDSVYTVNAVDEILKEEADCVIYNISRIVKKKFVPLCPREEEFTFEQYINLGTSVWNNAFSTRFVVDNGIFIKKMDYLEQLMFLLNLYSLSKKIRMVQQTLVCREKLVKPKKISYVQFYENRKNLKKILKSFNLKGMHSVSKKLVADFVFENIDVYYEEKNFFRKMLIRYRIRKYICI